VNDEQSIVNNILTVKDRTSFSTDNPMPFSRL